KSMCSIHEKAFIWEGYSSQKPELVDAAFKQAEQTQQELGLVEKEITDSEILMVQKNADYDRYRKAVNEFEIQLVEKRTEFLTLERQIKSISFEDYKQIPEADLKLKIEQLYSNLEFIKERFEAFAEKHKVLSSQKITLSERISSSRQFISENEQ